MSKCENKKKGPLSHRSLKDSQVRYDGIFSITPWEGDEYFNSIKTKIRKSNEHLSKKSSSLQRFYRPKNGASSNEKINSLIKVKTVELRPETKLNPFSSNERKMSLNKMKNQNSGKKKTEKVRVQVEKREKKRSEITENSEIVGKRLEAVENEDKGHLLFFLQARKHNNVMAREKNIMKIRNIIQKKTRFKTFNY